MKLLKDIIIMTSKKLLKVFNKEQFFFSIHLTLNVVMAIIASMTAIM